MSAIEQMQTYKRVPTLDMVKRASKAIDLDAINKMAKDMDDLLSGAYIEVAKRFKEADAAYVEMENVFPAAPDEQPGFVTELTEKEAEAEFEKYQEIIDYHIAMEKAVDVLDKMQRALAEVTS